MAVRSIVLEKALRKVLPALARLPVLNNLGRIQAYTTRVGGSLASDDDLHFYRYWYSSTAGEYVELKFRGSILIVLFGHKDDNRGIANVYVDGTLVKKVDLYNPTIVYNYPEFISDRLSPEEHVVRIEVSGEKNPSSTAYRIDVQGIFVDSKLNPHFDIYHEYHLKEIFLQTRTTKEYVGVIGRDVDFSLETTTPLGAGAEYIGTRLNRNDRTHAWFHAMGFADVDGTIYIDQSHDGTNWDLVSSTPLTGGAGKALSERVVSRYVRIRYVNGTVAQTTFRFGRRFTFA